MKRREYVHLIEKLMNPEFYAIKDKQDNEYVLWNWDSPSLNDGKPVEEDKTAFEFVANHVHLFFDILEKEQSVMQDFA